MAISFNEIPCFARDIALLSIFMHQIPPYTTIDHKIQQKQLLKYEMKPFQFYILFSLLFTDLAVHKTTTVIPLYTIRVKNTYKYFLLLSTIYLKHIYCSIKLKKNIHWSKT